MLIEPGVRVGPLALGDTRWHAQELFPPKAGQSQEWKDKCGTTFNWSDGSDGVGNILVRVRNERVFQIESGSPRFHTPEGITLYDSPDKVRLHYKDLRAYVLLSSPIRALGDRPLVFWLSKKKGIAFAFAYYQREHKRYLYKIIVFRPNGTFCPEDATTESPNWHELAPYSLEPPDQLALAADPFATLRY
jgi:hypothetical protein